MGELTRFLKCSSSVLAFAAIACAGQAAAQTAQPTPSTAAPIEEVVVTGTSIRGVAPVGSNLISVGPSDIAATGAQTISQVLENVPALTSMGNAGQGPTSGSSFQPNIHQLGGSASSSTLVLVDGHRIASSGTNHTQVDPNIVPVAALERVEVLADGSSSIYGSDAVAGVVNFITRRKFDGIQIGAQAGFLDGATDEAVNVLAGTSWDKGSVYFAYSYSFKGMLKDTARPYTNPNQTARGGDNFNNFYCSPAAIQPQGSSVYYTAAAPGGSIPTNSDNAPCNQWAAASLLPTEVRDSGMIKGYQQINDRLTVGAELLYATLRDKSDISRGTLSATAFGSGDQANPFFTQPAGYTGDATRQNIRWSADDLFGPGAIEMTGSNTVYGDVNAEYKLGGDFVVDLLALGGRDDSFTTDVGTINGSVADLALNGTTNASGSLTSPSITGTTAVITQLPLTTATALDVWNPAATNRTSQAVKDAILDNANYNRQVQGVEQFRISTNGTAFRLPAGGVKIAVGGEYLSTQLSELTVQGANAGTASSLSTSRILNFNRQVYSAYAEVNIPVISPEMGVPLVQRFSLDISGRYDDYSDFGETKNPKFAFDWQVNDDVKLRGNISTSFVAPTLDILGNQYGIYNNSRYQSYQTSINIPVAAYPELTQMGLAGCTAASTTCNISSLEGIRINTGDHNAKAQRGRGWSLGADFTPDFLPGLTAQATFWHQTFLGGITGPTIGVIANTASMNRFLTFYPNGATPAQIAALTQHIPQIGAIPGKVSYILDVVNSNYINLAIEGIDASFTYRWDTDNLGSFRVGDALTQFTKFDQSYGNGAYYSVLNTTGANNTFPSIATQMRANFGWTYDSFTADLFWNLTGAYRNWGSPVNPILTNAQGNPVGGGDHVGPNSTFDLHLGYGFSGGIMGDDEISLEMRNIFDRKPPFYNADVGYDTFAANPLGRVVSVGLTANL